MPRYRNLIRIGMLSYKQHWQSRSGPHVRLWHKEDMLSALTNFRFWEQSGH